MHLVTREGKSPVGIYKRREEVIRDKKRQRVTVPGGITSLDLVLVGAAADEVAPRATTGAGNAAAGV